MESKKYKHGKASKGSSSGVGIDRLSNLPEHLISHILSLLETKYAVATSVLSTRWKFLWTSITNLHFVFVPCNYGSLRGAKFNLKRNEFTHFVNRVLRLLNPPSIQNFHLFCIHDDFNPSYLKSCISQAIERTVGELDLCLWLEKHLKLPLSYTCCNAAVLKLEGDIHLTVPEAASLCFQHLHTLCLTEITFRIARNSSVSFPSLKILDLKDVIYSTEDSVNKLLSSCPVLVNLVIRKEILFALPYRIIRIPSLTSLTIDFEELGYSSPLHKLQIDTPGLQYLNIKDELPCEYLLADNISSLLQANLELNLSDDERGVNGERRCLSIFKCIGSSSTLKFLSVSGQILKAIMNASPNISPAFHNLTRLELKQHSCLDLSALINALEIMDSLEHLVMEDWSCKHSHQCRWTEPVNVPKCLLSSVTTITFNNKNVDFCDQLELLRYFLKNAEVLQLLTIRYRYDSMEILRLLQKISMYPRGSRTCKVSVT